MSGHGGWGGRWRGPGWRGAGWRGPGPPPWWPQGEAWPPAGRPTWPRMGRRFMWRVAWFVADLTHEFRTPLAIIRGQAEGIGDGVYPGDQPHLAPILDATASLETLVEALGTMTLADVGSLRLHREPVEVGVLINSSLAAFQSLADGGGVRLTAEISADTPALDADPVRIRSVLANLLSNAIRHTPAGGSVSVSARSSGGTVSIEVRDTGEGIPEEVRSRVFERFVKGAA